MNALPNDYVDRDPDTIAIYQRHPAIRQQPLITRTETKCERCDGTREVYVGRGFDDPYTHDRCPDCDD